MFFMHSYTTRVGVDWIGSLEDSWGSRASVVVAEDENVEDVSEKGRGLIAFVIKCVEVGRGEFGEDEPTSCFDGILENNDLLELLHIDLAVYCLLPYSSNFSFIL